MVEYVNILACRLESPNSLQLPFKDLDLVSIFSLDINKFDNTYDRYSSQNN